MRTGTWDNGLYSGKRDMGTEPGKWVLRREEMAS